MTDSAPGPGTRMDAEPILPTPQRRRRINWQRLKADYVEGFTDTEGKTRWPTLRELAEKHGIHGGNVRDRAAAERWVDERATFQRRVEDLRQIERSTELASLGADLDVSALRIARNGLAVTASRLQELGERAGRRREALRQNEGRETASTPEPPDSDEVATLSRAAAAWYDLGTKALGDTSSVRVDLEVSGTVELEHTLAPAARAVELTNILIQAGAIDAAGRGDVLDVAERTPQSVRAAVGTEDQPVHPEDVDDDREPEPETTGVPATRSA